MARGNSYEELAREAAERIDAVRSSGQQLDLLSDREPALPDQEGKAGRGKGKAQNQLREHLAARGYRLPEDVLAQMAGLATRDDAITAAMVAAERIAAWAYAGKEEELEEGKAPKAAKPSPSVMLRIFETVYSAQIRAADALLPYGLGKVTPDVQQTVVVPIVHVPSHPTHAERAANARDVTPARRSMMPADLAHRIDQGGQEAQPVHNPAGAKP